MRMTVDGVFLSETPVAPVGSLGLWSTGCHSVGWDVRGLDMLQTMWYARVGVVQAGAKRRL